MSNPIPKLPYNIYWINLDRRPDRRTYMEEILINNQGNNFRISAIDYKNNFKPYNVIKHTRLNGGEHGCACSHIKALHYFLSTCDDKYCFIAEDDLLDIYSNYWNKEHYNILKDSKYNILQLQTTTDIYNNNEGTMAPENIQSNGATIYRIHRNIAEKIINNHYDNTSLTINLSNHNYPVADNLIWTYGNVYLLPMFSYVDACDSDTNTANKTMALYYVNYFKRAINKYLNFWKNNK
jgi:hypothetical protein